MVEHDKDMSLAADYVIDIGPGAGLHGGRIVAEGTPESIMSGDSLTAAYIRREMEIAIPEKRRPGNGNKLVVHKATGNNLKNVTVEIPLGMLVCVTGVSGSGKSTLINETLFPALNKYFLNSHK